MAAPAAATAVRVVIPATVRVVDEAKREIEVCATSEAIDQHGTIFDYEASKGAFNRWVGNIREMHDRKAVGSRVAVRVDDDAKKVYVRLHVSKGAEDTWQKVLDGTLKGASIGACNVVWQQQRRAAGGTPRTLPVATYYDLAELSLVDNPSNPDGLGIEIIRATPAPGPAPGPAAGPAVGPAVGPGLGSATVGNLLDRAILERDGSLTLEDPALQIAAAALARGKAQMTARLSGADPSAGALTSPGEAAKRARLAALGAPGYVATAQAQPTAAVAAVVTPAETRASTDPGAGYDFDGDHDQPAGAGPARLVDPVADATAGMAHDGGHAHDAHTHAHEPTDYALTTAHHHGGLHTHRDGTQHDHQHSHSHQHHEHQEPSERAAADLTGGDMTAGHSHAHNHVHDHEHYYRVADGAALDEALVTGEQARTLEYLPAAAFFGAGGLAGQPMTAVQFRAAAGLVTRDLGPWSQNPVGYADVGVPAVAAGHAPTAALTGEAALGDGNQGTPALSTPQGGDLIQQWLAREGTCPLCQGHVNAFDAQGQPTAADANGQPAPGVAPNGPEPVFDPALAPVAEMSAPAPTVTRAAPAAPAAPTSVAVKSEDIASLVASVLQGQETRLVGSISTAIGATIGETVERLLTERLAGLRAIETRLAALEAQPQPGGPVLRSAERSTPLSPIANGSSVAERIRALEGLAGRVADPQAQMAVAAEMIRLQQEAAGVSPDLQAMPVAGAGRSRR